MKVFSTIDLFLAAKPPQYEILDKILATFSESKFLHSAYVRGSLASSSFDRASDVDFAAVFEEKIYQSMIPIVSEIVRTQFNVLLPPWKDSIVKDFGGSGLVFLIEYKETIYSLDLYILPSSSEASFQRQTNAKLIYSPEEKNKLTADFHEEIKITSNRNPLDLIEEIFVEIFTIAFLVTKRINRGQKFLNYSETFLMNQAFCRLIRVHWPPNQLTREFFSMNSCGLNIPNAECGA